MNKISKPGFLKGALIGYGFIGSKGHIPAYQKREDVKIIALSDISKERRQKASLDLPDTHIYNTHWELLDKHAGELDFVDISTPPIYHHRMALECLEKGVHVLCEKPIATETALADQMIQKAKEVKKVLFPCHNYKHAPVVRAIAEAISKVGPITSVTLQTFRNTHAKGVSEWRSDWRRDKKFSGGGIAMDHGSHSFYLLFDWLREIPTSVSALSFFSNSLFDTEDLFNCSIKFPNGFAQVYLSWTSGMRKVVYTLNGKNGAIFVNDDEIETHFKKASEEEHLTAKWEIEKKSLASHWMDASHVTWFHSLFDEFKKAIEENSYINSEIIQSRNCIYLIEKAYESSRQNSLELPLSFTVDG